MFKVMTLPMKLHYAGSCEGAFDGANVRVGFGEIEGFLAGD